MGVSLGGAIGRVSDVLGKEGSAAAVPTAATTERTGKLHSHSHKLPSHGGRPASPPQPASFLEAVASFCLLRAGLLPPPTLAVPRHHYGPVPAAAAAAAVTAAATAANGGGMGQLGGGGPSGTLRPAMLQDAS